MKNIVELVNKKDLKFVEVMQLIEANYTYKPTLFTNGVEADSVTNTAGSNEGSCKVFAFAKIHNLTKEQTLLLFGEYYRDDVLGNLDGDDHANIRTFMKYGWEGIAFESEALIKK